MAIDALGDRTLSGMQKSLATTNVTAKTDGTQSTGSSRNSAVAARGESVELTDSAKTMSNATEKAKASSGIDQEKVDKLKKAINEGTYEVNYESVASKLIDSEDELSAIFG